MDTKQLVEKFVNGEITQEQFDEETSKLSPEAKEQLNKDAEAAMPSAVEKLKGVRRGIQKVGEGHQQPAPAEDVIGKKIREENLAEAESQFFSQHGIEKEEDKSKFREGFKKRDGGSVNVANILKDMRSYYASENADELLNIAEEKKRREAEAEEVNSQNAGAHGSGGGNDPTKKISKDVKAIMDASAKTGRVLSVEEAEKRLQLMKNKGHIG